MATVFRFSAVSMKAATRHDRLSSCRTPAILTLWATALVVVSAAPALLSRDFYRLTDPVLLPGSYGQDLVSLLAAPVLVLAVRAAARGSRRGLTIWLGLLLYYAYGYLLYSFGPHYSLAYPLYPAIVSLTVFAGVLLGLKLNVHVFAVEPRSRFTRPATIALFAGIVALLTPIWLAMMLSSLIKGKPSPFTGVFVLDLAFVFPTLVIAAIGLWLRAPWSLALSGPLLIKTAALMSGLVVSEVVAFRMSAPDPWPLALIFAVLAISAGMLAQTYVKDLEGGAGRDARASEG